MQVLNFEMETSGLYGLGKILGHQCVSISTVTNNRITTQAIHDMDVAVDDMIRKTLAIIEGI
jgi:uridine phosphorylase